MIKHHSILPVQSWEKAQGRRFIMSGASKRSPWLVPVVYGSMRQMPLLSSGTVRLYFAGIPITSGLKLTTGTISCCYSPRPPNAKIFPALAGVPNAMQHASSTVIA